MARQINLVVSGSLKTKGIPQDVCFESFAELLKSLEKYVTVEVPRSITNVTVGDTPPGEDRRDNLWVRFDKSGNYLGNWVFVKGNWQLAYTFAPNQIIWMTGDSRVIPQGFKLVDENNGSVPSDVAQVLQGQYVIATDNFGLPYYRYFAVTYNA